MAAHFDASRILKQSFSDLVRAIELHNPASVAVELFSNEVIAESVLKSVSELQLNITAEHKATLLMTSCYTVVKEDTSKFLTFLFALEKCKVAPEVVSNLKKKYDTLSQQQQQQQQQGTSQDKPEKSSITVGRHVQKEFDHMCSQFADMFKDVMNDLTANVGVDEIKNHICIAFRDLKPLLCNVKTKDDLSEVLRDECNFTNYNILSVLVEKYKRKDSHRSIAAYTKKRDKYYKKVLAKDFAKLAIKQSQNGQAKVTFVVRWARGEATLKDFQNLMENAFESIHQYITLVAVKQSMISFICSIPQCVMGALRRLVKEKKELMITQGLVMMTVEEEVIMECNDIKQELSDPHYSSQEKIMVKEKIKSQENLTLLLQRQKQHENSVHHLAGALSELTDSTTLAVPISHQYTLRKEGVQHWKVELFLQWLSTHPSGSLRDGLRVLEDFGHLNLATKLKTKYFLKHHQEITASEKTEDYEEVPQGVLDTLHELRQQLTEKRKQEKALESANNKLKDDIVILKEKMEREILKLSCQLGSTQGPLRKTIEFDAKPFAEGRFRYAYKGHWTSPPSKVGQLCVVKKLKASYTWEPTGWDTTLEMYDKCGECASAFGRNIEFAKCAQGKVISVGSSNNPRGVCLNEYVVYETYLKGQFTKWCNNYGYVSTEAQGVDSVLTSFMHWTWCKSKGQEMVADLQGVKQDGRYNLTDPAVLSVTNQYGVTDTGIEGMAMFFLDHKCSGVCSNLPKPTIEQLHGNIPNAIIQQAIVLKQLSINRTTYSHEIKFTSAIKATLITMFMKIAQGSRLF